MKLLFWEGATLVSIALQWVTYNVDGEFNVSPVEQCTTN